MSPMPVLHFVIKYRWMWNYVRFGRTLTTWFFNICTFWQNIWTYTIAVLLYLAFVVIAVVVCVVVEVSWRWVERKQEGAEVFKNHFTQNCFVWVISHSFSPLPLCCCCCCCCWRDGAGGVSTFVSWFMCRSGDGKTVECATADGPHNSVLDVV